ncbi:hypothetical protein CDD80_7376 [Ophiocordyceps camponoti-rufipedis]|uniref:HTH La-type RNA-binding domain-containing protein n=1 Tax=Ophiocordyceps camponoti-rufipedis TaxID=2004952 RepID=A0A2C5YIQ9_9HYPO|nr:hypothetical protein CDD80_7376 [Ophiocordyceps camponoti-rufipedis]
MAAPSTFSYAQAAKGHGVPSVTASPSNPPVQAQGPQPVTSMAVVPDKPTNPSALPRSADTISSLAEKQEIDSSFGSESDLRSETAIERRLESKRDDDASRIDRPWRRADRGPRSSSSTAHSVEDYDSRKSRSTGKKPWTSDSFADDHAPVADKEQMQPQEVHRLELSEAPIPSVNIWQQRREAQLAKSKPASDSTESPTNGLPAQTEAVKKLPPTKPAVEDCLPTRDVAPTNGARPMRNMADTVRPERNGSRIQRPADGDQLKEAKPEVLPFVEDAAAWPTPETAIKEEKRKSIPTQGDRQDKEPKEAAEEGTHTKPRQKGKWVAYDYVPSVNFETQIPQMRTSKPRGGARGSALTRGPIGTTAGDRAAQATTAANKPSDPKDRPRDVGSSSVRTSTSPPLAKRASVDGSFVKDQKRVSNQTAGDKAKDTASQSERLVEQNQGPRDRVDGRVDKGRGSFRGRGGHHAINTYSQHHHQQGLAAGPMQSRQPQGPYSPPPRQGGHGQTFMSHPARGGRGRNGGGANYHRMSLPNGSTRLAPVQTQFGPYEYPMAPLSAIPSFQPHHYWDSILFNLLKNQIEYYFSIENLCKDMYLRRRMDSQGLVHLHFVAAFKRIRDLTPDMAMIRAVCESSNELDFVVGEDDVERIRRKSGWHSFVLPMEDRDTFARTDGPARLTFKNRPWPQFDGTMTPASFSAPPPLAYNAQVEAQFPQAADGHALFNGNGGGMGNGGSSLSAEVPVFSPLGTAAPSVLPGLGPGNGPQSAATGGMEGSTDAEAPEPLGQANGHGVELGLRPASSMTNNS